ncbi:hypothetical protein Tco_1057659 [Tanacetum coccineum]|uniref:Uncharacterized protein n=1 Tax=Tanacetum coccineum TaxID=301880 RepID=A0ABQ5H7T4_9ASTR
MAYFRSLHSHLQVLSNQDLKGTRIEHGFKWAFMSLFGQDNDTFISTMLLNVDQLQKQLDKDEFQEDGSMVAFWVINRQFQQFINSQFTLDYDSQMTDKYFAEYTGIEVKQFRETLLQHMSNVKKSIAERTCHKRLYDRRKAVGPNQKCKIQAAGQGMIQIRGVYALVDGSYHTTSSGFGDDDFEDDTSDGFGEEEVWEVNEDWLMAPTTPPPVLAMPQPSIYKVSDAEVVASVTIREIGPRVLAVEGQMQVMASQMIQAVDRMEHVGAQVELGQQTATQRDETVTGLTQQVQALQIEVHQRDMQIQHLQTTVSEISSRESSLMQCILGLDKRIAALERKPLVPQ